MGFHKLAARAFFVLAIFTLSGSYVGAQTLDQKAWNSVWDRLGKVLPAGNSSNVIEVLKLPVPAVWVNRTPQSLLELQHIASAIPDENFLIDPSRNKLELHKLYANIVLDVQLPDVDPAEEAKFLALEAKYKKIFDDYLALQGPYLQKWEAYKKDLIEQHAPVDALARQQFRKDQGGYWRDVNARLEDASRESQRYAPVAQQWATAVKNLRDEVTNAQSDMRGLWDYQGSYDTLASITTDCALDGAGWEKLTFNRSVTSERIRTDAWNGNGGWEGAFIHIGAGGSGSSFDKVVQTDGEYIALRFCNLTYTAIYPDTTWFDISVLQGIDNGILSLKPKSPFKGKQILGPKGLIPRLVKGAIVARSIALEAKLSTSTLSEYRHNIDGGGGVSIGPFHIGGSGGSSEYSKTYTTSDGAYGRSTAFSVPAVIAIITEPTADN